MVPMMVDFSGLRVKLLHPNAKLPTKAHSSAGYDLYAVESVVIPTGRRLVIPIGIATEIPFGYFGKVMDRSGSAARAGITVLAGVMDNDFRGEWKVILLNTGLTDSIIHVGDRIAQVVFMPYGHFEVNEIENLSDTVRGEGCLGSTGR